MAPTLPSTLRHSSPPKKNASTSCRARSKAHRDEAVRSIRLRVECRNSLLIATTLASQTRAESALRTTISRTRTTGSDATLNMRLCAALFYRHRHSYASEGDCLTVSSPSRSRRPWLMRPRIQPAHRPAQPRQNHDKRILHPAETCHRDFATTPILAPTSEVVSETTAPAAVLASDNQPIRMIRDEPYIPDRGSPEIFLNPRSLQR